MQEQQGAAAEPVRPRAATPEARQAAQQHPHSSSSQGSSSHPIPAQKKRQHREPTTPDFVI